MKVLIAIVLCLAMVTVCGAGSLFFEDWTIKEAGMNQQGLIQAIMVNPDPKGDILSVVVIVHPVSAVVISYWYIKKGLPKLFILNEGKYESGPVDTCLKCHFRTI